MPHRSRVLASSLAIITACACAASCSSPGGTWGSLAVSTAPPKTAVTANDDASRRAKDYFRQTLAAGRWDDLPQVTRALTAAYLDHPGDPELALLTAHAHLWRISERARDQSASGDPTITDELVLAQHYFQQAAALAPADRHIPGWLGSTEMAVGTVNNEQATIRRGYFRTRDAAAAYPEFHGFTLGFSLSGTSGEQFEEALEAMWRSADRCSAGRVSAKHPVANPATSLPHSADPACFNTPKAPHNWEGFWWTLGLMELKAGHTDTARTAMQNSRRSPEYQTWAFRQRLEIDLSELDVLSTRLAKHEPAAEQRMTFGSAISCVVCHQH